MNKNKFLPLFFLFLFSSLIFAQSWNEVNKLTASERTTLDEFGNSVAISGNYIIVGASGEDEDISNGNTLERAGAAYIFQSINGSWKEVQKIVASDRNEQDNFGKSVSISGDFAIVGAYFEDEGSSKFNNSGAAYIFQNVNGTWTEIQKLVPSVRDEGDQFGESVSISGNYAIIGARHEDENEVGSDPINKAGCAYVFKYDDGIWIEEQKLVASDRSEWDFFGISVSISGNYTVIGAYWEDEDNSNVNTLDQSGSAYIFQNVDGEWSEIQKITASDRGESDTFGESVSISGDFIIIGAGGEDEDVNGENQLSGAGSAYIFKNNSGIWTEVNKIVAADRNSGDRFGESVAITNNFAIVGSVKNKEDELGNNSLIEAGSAYTFSNKSGLWAFDQKLVSSDREQEDWFGNSVAISSEHAIVGVKNEDENESGQDSVKSSGSAYVFRNNNAVGVEENIIFPKDFRLSQNYPNPFNPTTTIKYSVPNVADDFSQRISLKIYDVLGKDVKTIVNKQQSAGNYEVGFNGKNIPSGIYYYTLQTGEFSVTKKMVLLK